MSSVRPPERRARNRPARAAFVARDEIEIGVEFLRDEPRRLHIGVGSGFDLAIEPREQRHGEAIVVAVARDAGAVGADIGVDLAFERADEQRLGDRIARDERCGAPAEREGGALRGAAVRIGRGGGEPDAAAGGFDAVALGERLEEAALVGGGPAVGAALDGGVIVFGRLGEEGFEEHRRWVEEGFSGDHGFVLPVVGLSLRGGRVFAGSRTPPVRSP